MKKNLFLASLLISSQSFAMTEQNFLHGFAKCSYSFFAAGFKWNHNSAQRQAVIDQTATNLKGVFTLTNDDLNANNLQKLCDAYQDLSSAQGLSKQEFEDGLTDNGFGGFLDAFKEADRRVAK